MLDPIKSTLKSDCIIRSKAFGTMPAIRSTWAALLATVGLVTYFFYVVVVVFWATLNRFLVTVSEFKVEAAAGVDFFWPWTTFMF